MVADRAQQGAGRHLHRDPHRLPRLLPARPRVGLRPRPRLSPDNGSAGDFTVRRSWGGGDTYPRRVTLRPSGPRAMSLAALVAATALSLVAPLTPAAQAAALAAPGGLAVANKNSSTPILSWSKVKKAVAYQVQVDNDASFASPEFTSVTVNSRAVPTAALRPGKNYWRVQSLVEETASSWSQGSFDVSPVGVPVPTSPANGSSLVQPDNPPLLRWNGAQGATSYTVQLDGDADFIGAKSYVTKTTSLVVHRPPDRRHLLLARRRHQGRRDRVAALGHLELLRAAAGSAHADLPAEQRRLQGAGGRPRLGSRHGGEELRRAGGPGRGVHQHHRQRDRPRRARATRGRSAWTTTSTGGGCGPSTSSVRPPRGPPRRTASVATTRRCRRRSTRSGRERPPRPSRPTTRT